MSTVKCLQWNVLRCSDILTVVLSFGFYCGSSHNHHSDYSATIVQCLWFFFSPMVIRLDNRLDDFFVPMQCTGNLDCFSRGKRGTLVRHYPASHPPICSVFVFPYHRLWGLLIDMGSLTCTQICVNAIHTKGGYKAQNKTAQHWTRRDRKTVSHPSPPGDFSKWAQGLWIGIPTL